MGVSTASNKHLALFMFTRQSCLWIQCKSRTYLINTFLLCNFPKQNIKLMSACRSGLWDHRPRVAGGVLQVAGGAFRRKKNKIFFNSMRKLMVTIFVTQVVPGQCDYTTVQADQFIVSIHNTQVRAVLGTMGQLNCDTINWLHFSWFYYLSLLIGVKSSRSRKHNLLKIVK